MLIPGTPPFTYTSDSSDYEQNAQWPDSSDVTLCTQAPKCRRGAACTGHHSFSGDRGSDSTVEQPKRREVEVEVEQPDKPEVEPLKKEEKSEAGPSRPFPPRIKMKARKRVRSPPKPPSMGELYSHSCDEDEEEAK